MTFILLAAQSIAVGILALGIKANGLNISRVFKDGLLKVKDYFKKA